MCQAEKIGVVPGCSDKMGVVGREMRHKNMCGRTKKVWCEEKIFLKLLEI